jgi:hypothetical protein
MSYHAVREFHREIITYSVRILYTKGLTCVGEAAKRPMGSRFKPSAMAGSEGI